MLCTGHITLLQVTGAASNAVPSVSPRKQSWCFHCVLYEGYAVQLLMECSAAHMAVGNVAAVVY